MSETIHAHEVLQMIAKADAAFSVDSLRLAVADAFGEEARFATCGGSQYTFSELLEFLQSKEKITVADDTIALRREHICTDM